MKSRIGKMSGFDKLRGKQTPFWSVCLFYLREWIKPAFNFFKNFFS